MTSPYEPAGQQPPVDVIAGAPEPARRGGRGRTIAAVAAAALTLGVGGGAVYAATRLAGGGAQPEDVLPASAIGFVKIDLDPAAGQKIAAYQLAKKFPDSGVKGQDSVRDDLLRSLLKQDDEADYDAHVRPWLGQRAGAAFLPPTAARPDEPVVVAAVQFTDRAKAEEGLKKLAAEQKGGDPVHYAFAEDEGYVLLSEDQAAADAAATQQEHLAADPDFEKGVKALDGDQIAVGWMDFAALWRALPDKEKQQALGGRSDVDLSGLAVFGAHVADGTVEVVGRTVEFSAGYSPEAQKLLSNPLGRGTPTGLIKRMPADSLGAVSITGLGPGLAALYDTFPAEVRDDQQFQSAVQRLGLRLPGDLSAVFGSEAAFSLGGELASVEPRAGVRVNTADPDRAVELLDRGRELVTRQQPAEGAKIEIGKVDGGYAAGYGLAASALTDGTLGDSELFRRTLPDVDTSGLTYYLDVQRLIRQVDAFPRESGQGLTDTQRRNLAPLQAAGYTATLDGGGNATFRFRLTVQQ